MAKGPLWLSAAPFLALLGATTALLWTAHLLSFPTRLACALGIVSGLWAVASLCSDVASPEQGSSRIAADHLARACLSRESIKIEGWRGRDILAAPMRRPVPPRHSAPRRLGAPHERAHFHTDKHRDR